MSEIDPAKHFVEHAARFWDLGNYIAGFTVAQTIVLLFALGKDEGLFLQGIKKNFRLVLSSMIVFAIILGLSIFFAYQAERQLWEAAKHTNDAISRASCLAMWGRLICVLLFTGLGIVVLRAKTRPQKKEDNARLDD